MARPFWSGQLRISLVAFGIQLFPATEAKSEIRFHQLNRKTGDRVKHQNVSGEDGPIDKEEIVKGYEYSKGKFVMIEPEDIENLRVPSRQTLDVTQFVDEDELPPEFFEKPYFVTPDNPTQAEAFLVVRKALQTTRKFAMGKIAFGGREHLIAISVPRDDKKLGMMAFTMRYAQELRKADEYFAAIPAGTIDEEQLDLAKELIRRNTRKFDPEKFNDQYEVALRELIDAKIQHMPVPKEQPAAKTAKVINLMDALRKSVQSNAAQQSKQAQPPAPEPTRRSAGTRKLAVVGNRAGRKPVKSAAASATRRKSA
jgi:DNA end-binding protein Ku